MKSLFDRPGIEIRYTKPAALKVEPMTLHDYARFLNLAVDRDVANEDGYMIPEPDGVDCTWMTAKELEAGTVKHTGDLSDGTVCFSEMYNLKVALMLNVAIDHSADSWFYRRGTVKGMFLLGINLPGLKTIVCPVPNKYLSLIECDVIESEGMPSSVKSLGNYDEITEGLQMLAERTSGIRSLSKGVKKGCPQKHNGR